MYMKTRTKIIIVLFVVLYIGLIFVVKTAERKNGVTNDKGIMGTMREYFVEIDYDEILSEYGHLLDTSLTLDLEMLKQGDEYHFDNMFWDISLIQVKKLVPYTMQDVSEVIKLDEGYSYYASGQMYDFEGEKVTAIFEFYEDQLKMVQLICASVEKPEKLFEDIVQSLHDICGEESESFENLETGEKSYKWEAEKTWLRVVGNDTNIIISVGAK